MLKVVRRVRMTVGVDALNPLNMSSGRDCRCRDRLYEADEELVRALSPAGQVKRVERDGRLFSSGEAAGGVYLIVKGTARATMVGEERELMCRTAGPGAVLGLTSALCAKQYQFDVQALEPVEAVFLETGTVNEILRGQPELCMRAMRMMCDELEALRQTREHMQSCDQQSCALHEQCSQVARLQ
jgi:CRP-like cAMP-binding protein